MGRLLSWGRYPRNPQTPHFVHWPEDVPKTLADIATVQQGAALAFGCGRSYGDSCLAESNHVLATQGMDRVLAADWETGAVRAQAGLTLAELIRVALPRGWFPPVTPGTKFVTLGGAVANDVQLVQRFLPAEPSQVRSVGLTNAQPMSLNVPVNEKV